MGYRLQRGIILYTLAAGSPTFPIDPAGYREWTSTFEVKTIYDMRHIYAGPLFIHQMSHIWLDFRGIHDDINRQIGFDYFENTRRATYIQRQYAVENPHGFKHYGEYVWGLTASDGPGPATAQSRRRQWSSFTAISRAALRSDRTMARYHPGRSWRQCLSRPKS